MRHSMLFLLPPCLLAGAPLAAETLEGQPCVFPFNNKPGFMVRTRTGALIPAPGLMPPELLHGLPPAMGTPVAAAGRVPDGSGAATEELHLTYRGKGGGRYDIGLYGRKAGSEEGGEGATSAPLAAAGRGRRPDLMFRQG